MRDFEDAGAQLTHHPDQLFHLVPFRQTARHRPAVRRLMSTRSRGAEARRPSLNRLAQFTLHRGEVVRGRRIIEGPLTHHVGAQRGMSHVRGIVDALGQAVDRVEVLGEVRP